MSLDADWSKIEGYDSLTDDECVTRNALTFATMATGIHQITDDNVRDFYARVSLHEKINGAMRYDAEGEPLFFTPADVKRFVGLRTNASRLTRPQFLKGLYDSHDRFHVYYAMKD